MRKSHPQSTPARSLRRVAAVALALSLVSCVGTRKLTDPVVGIVTDRGMELGVSTEFGVVFLGKTTDRGPVIVEAYFGDGPSMEQSVIEPVGGGLFTADMEILLPHVPISFNVPGEGEELEVMGRRGWDRWSAMSTCRSVDGVNGLLIEIPEGFMDSADQTGAGVYRKTGEFTHELVGLVSGKVTIQRDGDAEAYLAVVGADTLWRLAAHRKDKLRRRPFVYREDIL
ncbi:MAG: hypothetical protein P8M11_01340 [Planctomycetota bacterium]|nr:hypothetical protein [Planctomycetota bacterium]MDG1983189.1 hypothetical protein [Planctomycetota bacterium]